MIEMTIDDLLNKLESTITLAKKSFMSDMKMVDESVCLECIAQIRGILPSELSEARVIRKDAQNIVANAKVQAEKIVGEAQMKAAALVDENKIVDQAKAEADKILDDATNYANNIVGNAYDTVGKLMDDAENHARDILQVILDSKQSLFSYNDPNNPQSQQPQQ